MAKHPWCAVKDGPVYGEDEPVRDMYGVWHRNCWETAQTVRSEGTDAQKRRLSQRINRPIQRPKKAVES